MAASRSRTRAKPDPTSVAASLRSSPFGAPLALEHRRLMRASTREIDWSRSTAASLSPAMRTAMGDLWLATMEAEHRSAGIFATYVLDLMGAGAPREILSIASRAVLDEVRHAALAEKLASLYLDRVEAPAAGIPHVPDTPTLTLFEQSIRQALFLSVASETYSSVILAESRDRARDPVVRDVLGAILGDEVHHARLGWSYLAVLLQSERAEEVRAFVAQHLVGVFDELAHAIFGDERDLPAPTFRGRQAAIAEAHGYLSMRAQHRLFLDTMRKIWIPTLRGLRFDVTPLSSRWNSRRATR